MRKTILILLTLIVTISLVFGACKSTPESTTPPPPAEFEVVSLDIEPSEVVVGETVTITAAVENIGGSEGTYAAVLTVDGVTEETEEIVITAGSSRVVTFSLVKDTPGIYEIGVGDLSTSLVVNDTWTLSSPLFFLGTLSFDTIQTLGSYHCSRLGGTIDYVYQRLSTHWDSIRESNTVIFFSTSLDSLQRLGEWPEQYKEVCPFSIDELTVNNPPFVLLKRQDNGLIRAIILVDNESDFLTFIAVIEKTQVPVGIPWTLTNGEVTVIEGD